MDSAPSEVLVTPAQAARNQRELMRRIWIAAGVAATLAGVVVFYLLTGRYESTDDASLQAAQTTVSANIPGRVVAIAVHDNERVARGDVLFRIDDRSYRIAVDEARAKLATTRLQIRAAKLTYRQKMADVEAARSTLAYRQEEFERQEGLVAKGISSRAQFDEAQHALEQARAQLSAAQQQSESVLALLGGSPDAPLDRHPSVQQAQAALDKAELDLSYTVVVAPTDGIVAKVEQLQVGDYINAAAPLFTLVSDRDIWVEANFKEDQLTYMRPGQPAEVVLDAYSDHTLKARVASMSPGTGAQFSVLPPENATGNWVKVVQRLPVRLQLDGNAQGLPLQAGLSATVTVDTGHRRSFFGGAAEHERAARP